MHVPLTDDERSRRALEIGIELDLRVEVQAMNDRALIAELTAIWLMTPDKWGWDAVVLDEAIERIRRYDTQGRWDERKRKRIA